MCFSVVEIQDDIMYMWLPNKSNDQSQLLSTCIIDPFCYAHNAGPIVVTGCITFVNVEKFDTLNRRLIFTIVVFTSARVFFCMSQLVWTNFMCSVSHILCGFYVSDCWTTSLTNRTQSTIFLWKCISCLLWYYVKSQVKLNHWWVIHTFNFMLM